MNGKHMVRLKMIHASSALLFLDADQFHPGNLTGTEAITYPEMMLIIETTVWPRKYFFVIISGEKIAIYRVQCMMEDYINSMYIFFLVPFAH